jgi:DNA-binding beta-propeller fold protein YncE
VLGTPVLASTEGLALTRRLLILAIAFAALAPAAHAATTAGALVPLPGLDACISQTGTDVGGPPQVCRDGSGLAGSVSVAISPDGRNAYTAGFRSGLSIMSRDPATGALAPLGCVSSDGTDAGSGSCETRATLQTPTDVIVSPDGRNVYAAADKGITVFNRDLATGLLSQPAGTAACVSEDGSGGACVNGKAVDNPEELAISPDGASVYATDGRGGIAVLRRASDGSLSQSTAPQTGCITEDGNDEDDLPSPMACIDGKGLTAPNAITVSPDGKQVYVADNTSSGVTVLNRDSTTGELSQSTSTGGCVSENGNDGADMGVCGLGRALVTPGMVRVSPDGLNVYVSAFLSNGVAVFQRDPTTGELTQLAGMAGCVTEDGSERPDGPTGACGVARGLEQAFGIALSPSGQNLYVGSSITDPSVASPISTRGVILRTPTSSGGLAAFVRDPASGALVQLPGPDGCVNEVGGAVAPLAADGCAPGIALQGADELALSPDGGNVYVATQESNSVTEFAPAGPTPPPAHDDRDRTAPTLSRFSISHWTFTVTRAATPVSALARGTTFRFALSEAATVRISIQRGAPGRRVGKHCRKPTRRLRHRHACTRLVTAGTLRRSQRSGRRSVRFSGRIGRRALQPRRYRATIRATDAAGNVSRPKSLSFRIVKPR